MNEKIKRLLKTPKIEAKVDISVPSAVYWNHIRVPRDISNEEYGVGVP